MVSYAPYFISVVVVVAMINAFFDSSYGIFLRLARAFGASEKLNVINNANAFRGLYVWSGLWQTLGWSSIIYISSLASVSVESYEAATLDGATKFQKILFIEIPEILPTIVTLLILSAGNMLSVGFEKVYLMQNADNLQTSEVISTYVYKKGLLSSDYGFGTAVGLFNSAVNFFFLITVNLVSRKVSGYSIM